MKLLFDENLSHKLVPVLVREYPGSTHVRDIEMRGSDDREIWDYGREQGFLIVSKDTDFRERSFLEGHPPKIIWLDVGNTGTSEIEELLRKEQQRVADFVKQTETSLLILSIEQNAI